MFATPLASMICSLLGVKGFDLVICKPAAVGTTNTDEFDLGSFTV